MKDKIVNYLIEHQNQYTTGQSLSDIFHISRQSVWKHIQALKQDGYHIESVHRVGYKLMANDRLDMQGVQVVASLSKRFKEGLYLKTIESTNTYFKHHADQFSEAFLVADEQTGGRGRLGRQWQSEAGVGLWQSLLLRPQINPSQAAMLTQVAAVSMASAIHEITGLQAQIKWPNDLLIEGKKVCGILTEMAAELNAIQYVVVGIGLNVNQMTFNEDLADIATSLALVKGSKQSRLALLKAFIKNFENDYTTFLSDMSLKAIVKTLNDKSVLVGQDIRVIQGQNHRPARAVEVNALGELIIEEENGDLTPLYYGEVSVRQQKK